MVDVEPRRGERIPRQHVHPTAEHERRMLVQLLEQLGDPRRDALRGTGAPPTRLRRCPEVTQVRRGLQILGCHPDLWVKAADAEKHDVGADHPQCLDRGRADRDERVVT